MDFLNHREGGKVFYRVFLLSPLQCTVMNSRNCKRLREFEEIEISKQSCEVTVNSKEENSKTFVWISSKNSASG
jgi:hypothetical protein